MDTKLETELNRLRKKWRSEVGKHKDYIFDDLDLLQFDKLMRAETGYDFDKLKSEFDFRFSGAIVRPTPPNMDNSVLTVTTGIRNKHALPGGKMDTLKIPFGAFMFADFWARNSDIYEREVFGGSDKYKSALIRVLDRSNPDEIKRIINPLDELARMVDNPFQDGLSEIRREGFRELNEELDLVRITRNREIKSTQGPIDSKGQSLAYIVGAVPIDLFLDIYRVPAEGEEVTKKWFVAFDYLVEVRGEYDVVDRSVRDGFKKAADRRQRDGKEAEVSGVRWVSLVEVAAPGYEDLYHDDVHYFAVRVRDQKKILVEPRYGFVGGSYARKSEEAPLQEVSRDVVMPGPLGNGKSGDKGGGGATQSHRMASKR